MKKFKLHPDDLRIDSFHTLPAGKPKGTVFGEQCTCLTQCGQNTCPGCPTCDASCGGGTCAESCAGSCLSCEYTCQASCYGTCDYLDPSCVYNNCYSRDVNPEICM